MQGRNSVYESSRSAKCPRLGRANILPDRYQWWWGSEGRAPPENNDSDSISSRRSQRRNHRRKLLLAMRKKKKKTIFPSIFESQSRDLTWFRSARLRGATRYRSSVDKMSDTSGLKRSDSPHKPNVDSRKIVLSLFTAQPSSIVSLKPCNVLLYRSLYIAVYIQIRSYARNVKRIRLNRKM